MSNYKDISNILAGQKVMVLNEFFEKTILTIKYVEPSKQGICVVFTNGTHGNVKSIFDIAFI